MVLVVVLGMINRTVYGSFWTKEWTKESREWTKEVYNPLSKHKNGLKKFIECIVERIETDLHDMGVPTGAEVNVYFVVPKEADRKTLSGLLKKVKDCIVHFTESDFIRGDEMTFQPMLDGDDTPDQPISKHDELHNSAHEDVTETLVPSEEQQSDVSETLVPAKEQLSDDIPLKDSFKISITKKHDLVNEVINMKKKIETKDSQSVSFTECNDPISMSQEREEGASDDNPIQRFSDENALNNGDSNRALRSSQDGMSDPSTEPISVSDSENPPYYIR